LLGLAGPAAAQGFVAFGKVHYYVQTGAAAAVDDPSQGVNYGNGRPGATAPNGAYSFVASSPVAGAVAPPGGPSQSFVYISGDSQYEWPSVPAFATQAVLDSAYPDGNYLVAVDGQSVGIGLTGDLYPNAPLVTASQGSWNAAGTLVVDPTQPLVLTLNFTTNYTAGQSHLDLNIYGAPGDPGSYSNQQSSGSNLNQNQLTMTIPANSLGSGGVMYVVSADLATLSSLNATALSGTTIAGYYGTNGSLLIQAGQSAPPAITSQPQSQTVSYGNSTSFSAQASGTQPLTYQWYLNGVAIPGATQLGYNVNSATSAQAGVYTVEVTGAGGTVTSNGATLTVTGGPPAGVVYTPYTFTILTVAPLPLDSPQAVAVDGSGNLYLSGDVSIQKITPAGAVTTLVTSVGSTTASLDWLQAPSGIAVGQNGTVYWANNFSNVIGELPAGGSAVPFAGSFPVFFNAGQSISNGTGTAASFWFPEGMAIDASGNLYVADTDSNSIRMITPGGVVTTLAGSGIAGAPGAGSSDGSVATARFYLPGGVAVDASGNVYVADTFNQTVRKISVSGTVTTLAGVAGASGFTDGNGSAARFDFVSGLALQTSTPNLTGIAVDPSGANIYVADAGNNAIRRITSGGTVTTLAGGVRNGNAGGTGPAALFSFPGGIAVDSFGTLYVVDSNNGTVSMGQAALLPAIAAQPNNQTANAGSTVTLSVTSSGAGVTYQWQLNGDSLPGATGANLTLSNVQSSNAGNYSVVLTNAIGSTVSSTATLTVVGGAGAPVIVSQPQPQTVASGSTVVFTVSTNGSVQASSEPGNAKWSPLAASAATYQWQFNGVAIAGGTSSRLVISNATAANAGIYTCLVTNAGVSAVSGAATLAIAPTANPGRLINLSVLTTAGSTKLLTVGFTTGGSGTSGEQSLLIRGIGPALSAFGLPTPLQTDPTLNVIDQNGGASVASNDNWGSTPVNATAVTAADNATGAFPITVTSSLDAALVDTIAAGGYSVQVSSNNSIVGDVLAEVYDDTAAGTYTLATPRLINLSCISPVGAGGSVTAGFTIGGSTARTVLIRAVGPGLAALGVPSTMPDPQLVLNASSGGVVGTNAGWGGDPQLVTAMTNVNAFSLGSGTSLDSVLLITLSPGGYSAVASSVSGAAGTCLIEVYEVP
jgi:sugar lactone lactonase YvrE